MSVIECLKNRNKTAFSFEVLPPLKGAGLKGVFSTIDTLREFDPQYINITTHRSEMTYRVLPNGMYERCSIRRRPGTVAVAAAIQNHYDIPVVPHILCSGYSKEETEYVLLDLQFLGIYDLLVLRGDKAKDQPSFVPDSNGWGHALELQSQINEFNGGHFMDGSPIKFDLSPFHYGVAGYPEKHEEAPNLEQDLFWLKQKVDAGADYVVTQMFFDNSKFFAFVDAARKAGITVPIVPGIKPIYKQSQLTVLPKIFKVDFPQEFVSDAIKCHTDEDMRSLGIEWCAAQCKELVAHGVPSIHFYSVGAAESIREVAKRIY